MNVDGHTKSKPNMLHALCRSYEARLTILFRSIQMCHLNILQDHIELFFVFILSTLEGETEWEKKGKCLRICGTVGETHEP